MKSRTDKPSVSEDIMQKISQLTKLLDEARDLYDDIFQWYDTELKKYDRNADASSELFDPGNGYVVERISYDNIMEGLTTIQAEKEAFSDESHD